MKTPKSQNIVAFIIILLIVLFLIFLNFLKNISWFNNVVASKEIVPIDVANVFFSLMIAILIGYYLTKKMTELKFMKDFAIKDISKLEEEMDNFEKSINSSNKIETLIIFEKINSIQSKTNRFVKTAELLNFDCKEINSLKDINNRIFLLTTDNDDIYLDSRPIIEKINLLFDDYFLLIRKIIYKVNKL